jgi:hypothetical protein
VSWRRTSRSSGPEFALLTPAAERERSATDCSTAHLYLICRRVTQMIRSPFVIVLGMLLMAPAVHAQTGGKAAELEPGLRALVAELDARWNARDADSMSLLFTPEVDFRIYGSSLAPPMRAPWTPSSISPCS